jgi:predicted cobalt transporter CbtA
MVRTFLVRGMLVGIVAGLLAFGFAKLFGEPQINLAIVFETQMERAKAQGAEVAPAETPKGMNMPMGGMTMSNAEAAEPELVSREVQASIGLFTGLMVYSAAIGGLFALVFAFAYGRVGRLGPRATAALLAVAGYLAVVLVPALKYPPNPPSIGEPGTIGYRTVLFFVMLVISISALTLTVALGRRLVSIYGRWNAALIGGAAFIAIVAVAQFSLPEINEVPDQFSAVVLWRFRIASLGTQAAMWGTIGLLFGALTETNLVSWHRTGNRYGATRTSADSEGPMQSRGQGS